MNKNTENPVNAASWDKIFPKSDKVEHKKYHSKTAMVSPLLVTCTSQKTAKIRSSVLLLFAVDLEL